PYGAPAAAGQYQPMPPQTMPAQPMPTQPGVPAGVAQPAGLPQATGVGPQPGQTPPRQTGTDRGGRVGMSQDIDANDIALDEVLVAMVEAVASGLHLPSGVPPMIRVSGSLRPLADGMETLHGESLRRTIYQVLTQRQREKYEAELELDFAYAV